MAKGYVPDFEIISEKMKTRMIEAMQYDDNIYIRCADCSTPSTQEAFIAKTPCERCGGKLRPGVVLFGEGLPEDVLESSWDAAERADVFIVLGSSL